MLLADNLYEKNLYIVGDSAYSIRGFLLCPYDNTFPGSKEDSFNFFLSSQRIYVECAFGEIDRRFGIFWKALEGNLKSHKYTIDACMRLHNFIIDFREEMKKNKKDTYNDDFERRELDIDSDEFVTQNAGASLGVVGDNILGNSGRPSDAEAVERNRGIELRDYFCDEIAAAGMKRPTNDKSQNQTDRHSRVNSN